MELRLSEHLTGTEGIFGIPGYVDEQKLFLGEVGKPVLMQDGTAVGWNSSQEIVQQEMHGEDQPRETQQKQCEDLEFAKAANLLQNIFKVHFCQNVSLLIGFETLEEGAWVDCLVKESRVP